MLVIPKTKLNPDLALVVPKVVLGDDQLQIQSPDMTGFLVPESLDNRKNRTEWGLAIQKLCWI